MKSSAAQKNQNEPGSSCSHYNTRSCVARSSHVGSSKAAAQISGSPRITKCKGKCAALSLAATGVTGKNGASAVHFATADATDNKNKNSGHVTSKLVREKFLQSFLEKDVIAHIKADEDGCYDRPIKAVGARCQLCKMDVAFPPKKYSSEAFRLNELPTAAVLSCGHCYHKMCVEAVFGTVEPPCLACLDCS